MNSVSKVWTLTFIVLLLTSLLVLSVTSTNIQATSKPSIPQFTIKLVDNSYDVPPTQSTNPYTGEVTTQTGYRIEDMRIEVTIKNQLFINKDGYTGGLYYSVAYKNHFSDEWHHDVGMAQSDSQYTTWWCSAKNYAAGDKLDFMVEATIGRFVFYDDIWLIPFFVSDVSSGWSNIQTFTMPGASTTPPPQNPTTTPDNNNNNQPQQPDQNMPSFVFHPSFLLWLGTILFVGAIVIVVLAFLKRHLKPPNYNNPSHNILTLLYRS